MRGSGEAEGWVAEVVPSEPDVSCGTTQNKNKTSENRKQKTEIESRNKEQNKNERKGKSGSILQKKTAETGEQELQRAEKAESRRSRTHRTLPVIPSVEVLQPPLHCERALFVHTEARHSPARSAWTEGKLCWKIRLHEFLILIVSHLSGFQFIGCSHQEHVLPLTLCKYVDQYSQC